MRTNCYQNLCTTAKNIVSNNTTVTTTTAGINMFESLVLQGFFNFPTDSSTLTKK